MSGERFQFANIGELVPVTIADGASLSAAIDLGGATLHYIQTPAGIEGAALTFQASADGVTFVNLYDELGVEVKVPTAASRGITITNISLFYGVKYLKIRTGTAATPTAQTGDAVIQTSLAGV